MGKHKNKKVNKIIRQGDTVPQPSRKQGVDAYLQAVNQYNPQQQNAMQQALSQGQQYLGNLNLPGNELPHQELLGNLNLPGNPLQSQTSFAPIAENAQRQFNQVTVPGLAERFAAMGSGDKGSSAFTNSLSSAGADLQAQLAALGSQYGLQQQQLGLQEQGQQSNNLFNLQSLGLQNQGQQNNNLFNLLQTGLNPQEQFIHHGAQDRNGSGIGNFFRNNLGNIAQLGGLVGGGPIGAAIGGLFKGNNVSGFGNAQNLPGYYDASQANYNQRYGGGY